MRIKHKKEKIEINAVERSYLAIFSTRSSIFSLSPSLSISHASRDLSYSSLSHFVLHRQPDMCEWSIDSQKQT